MGLDLVLEKRDDISLRVGSYETMARHKCALVRKTIQYFEVASYESVCQLRNRLCQWIKRGPKGPVTYEDLREMLADARSFEQFRHKIVPLPCIDHSQISAKDKDDLTLFGVQGLYHFVKIVNWSAKECGDIVDLFDRIMTHKEHEELCPGLYVFLQRAVAMESGVVFS